MSLRVWLPLNGDLHNQGTSNLTFAAASTNTAVNTAGKIGSCYTNNSHSAGGLISNNPISLGTQYSMCCWFCFTDLESSSNLGGGLVSQHRYSQNTGFGLTIKYVSATTGYLSVNTGTGSSRTYNTYCGTTLLQANTWYHACGTYDGANIKIYLNGVLEKTQAYTMSAPEDYLTVFCWSLSGSSGATIHGDYKLNGSLNDVRIYDHCLSAEEVRDIANGLILHYKLDTLYVSSGTNLVTGVTQGGQTTVLTDGRIGVQTSGVNADTYFKLNLSENITAGTSYLLTCDASGISEGQYWNFPVGAQSNSGTLNFKIVNGYNVYMFTANATKPDGTTMDWGTTKTLMLDDNYRGDALHPACFYNFQLIKLEQNNTEIIVVDSSGYNHNGKIINGPLSLDNNSARYNNCIHISATNQKIQISNFPTSGFGNSYTFAWWAKITTNGPMHWGFSNGIRLNGLYNGNLWNTGDGSNNPLYNPGTTTQVTVPTLNVWHHWVMTGDGTKCRVYKDGVLWAEAKTYKAISGTTIYINGWDSSTSYSSNDYSVSDFRIYCTPLLDTEIKKLYNVSMGIDDGKNIHTGQFNEFISSSSLSKQSVVTGQINETIYCPYDPNIYIEPDGSAWIRIFHHNNPSAGSFASSNTFTTNVYLDDNRWFYVSLCNQITSWEFMVKGKFTADSAEWKLRWIQAVNPMTAVWADVAATAVIKNTSTGYSTNSWGGLYAIKSNTYLSANNGTNGNWWGAVGSYSVYQGGIPGWGPSGTITTTGFNDLYVRVDNTKFVNSMLHYDINWLAHQVIER